MSGDEQKESAKDVEKKLLSKPRRDAHIWRLITSVGCRMEAPITPDG
jgi:hypothetical protein